MCQATTKAGKPCRSNVEPFCHRHLPAEVDEPASVAAAASGGDELVTLQAMRDLLAASMDQAPATVVAQIAARLESVLARISELKPAGKETLNDVLAERRADRERRAKSAGAS